MIRLLRSLFAKFRSRKQGQVSEKDQIGRWLMLLASLEENSVILEIGTWNGLGTSKVIAKAVGSRIDAERVQVFGIEANQEFYRQAESNLHQFEFFRVIFGTIVSENQLDRSDLTSTENEWLAKDVQDLKLAPFVLQEIPDKIDLLVLDGGEFSTYAEFQILKDRVSKWVVLDDTNTRKSKKILQELHDEDMFTLVWSSHERNGTAVLIRK